MELNIEFDFDREVRVSAFGIRIIFLLSSVFDLCLPKSKTNGGDGGGERIILGFGLFLIKSDRGVGSEAKDQGELELEIDLWELKSQISSKKRSLNIIYRV